MLIEGGGVWSTGGIETDRASHPQALMRFTGVQVGPGFREGVLVGVSFLGDEFRVERAIAF